MAADGLYFCGLNWLNARKSGILLGVAADAERVGAAIARRLPMWGGSGDGDNDDTRDTGRGRGMAAEASIHKL